MLIKNWMVLVFSTSIAMGSHDSITRSTKSEKKQRGGIIEGILGTLTPEEEASIVQNGVQHDVPLIEQDDGPTCGIAALAMVMAYYHKKNPKNKNPPAFKGGKGNPNLESVFDFARRAKLTWNKGGTTTFWNQRDIARAYGYSANGWMGALHTDTPDATELRKMVSYGPVIVALSGVDDKGKPTIGNGMFSEEAHAVVIVGFFRHKSGTEYVLYKHGHGGPAATGGTVVANAGLFLKSWYETSRRTVQLWPPEDGK